VVLRGGGKWRVSSVQGTAGGAQGSHSAKTVLGTDRVSEETRSPKGRKKKGKLGKREAYRLDRKKSLTTVRSPDVSGGGGLGGIPKVKAPRTDVVNNKVWEGVAGRRESFAVPGRRPTTERQLGED